MPAQEALLKKYQLQPVPENVQRLAQLIQGGFDKNADEIAALIKADERLAARCITLASGSRKRDVPIEIDQAIVRLGVGSITLIVMGELLLNAMTRTFATMAGAVVELKDGLPELASQFVGFTQITGKANGRVYLRMPANSAKWLVSKLVGDEAAQDADVFMTEAVGELLNMVGGNFKSNLSDAGLESLLGVPNVSVVNAFQPEMDDEQVGHTLSFTVDGVPVFINLIIKPVIQPK
jgi:CheY-specific phosphatase CheX